MSPYPRPRMIAALMCFEAATLAVMSVLHLSGALDRGSKPFDPSDAGIAEAVICLVLSYGALALLRRPRKGIGAAIASTVFAIAGFIVGLTFTIRGGSAVDIAYHATVLPLLLLTLVALARIRGAASSQRGV
jgi:hypothetical protein